MSRCDPNEVAPTYSRVLAVLRLITTIAIFGTTLSSCASPSFEQVDWSLEDDIASYRAQFAGDEVMAHRIGELDDALGSPAYERFVDLVEEAPEASKAIIYYEAAPSAGHFYFALALQTQTGCEIHLSTDQGTRTLGCSGIEAIHVSVDRDTRLILDPGVAGIAQFFPSSAPPERSLRTLSGTSAPPDARALFDRMRATFSEDQGT